MSSRAFLISIKTGPTYRIPDQIQHLAEIWSERFAGEVLTYGPVPSQSTIGRFKVTCDQMPEEGGFVAMVRYAFTAIRRAREAAAVARRSGLVPVVVAYDPLFGGFVGVVAKLAVRAPLLIEINNAFGETDNWADIPSRLRRRLKVVKSCVFASLILACADGVRVMHKGQLDGIPYRKSKPIKLGFDTVPLERFANVPSENQEEKYILVVGYPYLRKGMDLAIAAYRQLRGKFPNWKLVLVGAGVEQCARNSGVDLEGVQILKPVPNEAMPDLIGRAGLILVPSRSEGIPRVLLEAAAASKARIAAAVNGVPRIIEHGVDGLLFEKENLPQLIAVLEAAMSSPELRGQLGARAKTMIHESFGREAYLDWLGSLVDASLAARGSRS